MNQMVTPTGASALDTADTVRIGVIVGSTRPGRFADKPARWMFDELAARPGVKADFLDLRDYPMPFFEEAVSPNYKQAPYANEAVKAWTARIAAADGFAIVAPEYNHGYTAVLKNAIDYVGPEWNNKAVGFVGYGGTGGARAIEQLRQVAVELQMTPIRTAIHLPLEVYLSMMKDEAPVDPAKFASSQPFADAFIDQLLWWTRSLKTARAVAA